MFCEVPGKFREINAKVAGFEKNSMDLNQVNVGILRNCTINQIDPYLKFHLYQNKIWANIIHGEFDNVSQDVINPNSIFNGSQHDFIVLCLFLKEFLKDYEINTWSEEDVFSRLEDIYSLLKDKYTSHIIINTFAIPDVSEFGILEINSKNSIRKKISRLNDKIRNFVENNSESFFLIDMGHLIYRLGYQNSIDAKMWYSFKVPFTLPFLNLYAKELFKCINAQRGKTKKCVVLDCDNTLWGGIIGEDGLEGISLSKFEGEGKVFYDFQKTLLHLHDRGILIALCSKNNPEDVWEVIDKHESCLLKRVHIVTSRINWDDKASNIMSIADELNIGIDSFLFLDDSPIECELVSEILPEVVLLKVPDNIYEYPNILLESGFFDSKSISSEDRERTKLYKNEAKRKKESKKYLDMDEFLSTLSLKLFIKEVEKSDILRVSQLTLKTNQFNLSTKRYHEKDILEFVESDGWLVYILDAEDKYGSYGKVGVAIFEKTGLGAKIDTFLLSCRVLSRNLEKVFLSEVIKETKEKWDAEVFSAQYFPTSKNKQADNFLDQFSFSVKCVDESDGKLYEQKFNKIKLLDFNYIKVLKG